MSAYRIVDNKLVEDRYINIYDTASNLKRKFGTHLAATCLRIRGYSLEQALDLLIYKKEIK